jgi:hypothetical protein
MTDLPAWSAFGASSEPSLLGRASSLTPPPPGFEAPSPPTLSHAYTGASGSGNGSHGSMFGSNDYDPFGGQQFTNQGSYPQHQAHNAPELATKNPFFTPSTGFMFAP